MIEIVKGNLLENACEALVNTVNCVGVMGRGIALQFKEKYPGNFAAYKAACSRGEVQLGKIFVYAHDTPKGPKWILNFPTKDHWRESSKLTSITEGLKDLVRVIQTYNIQSLALPPLGCGLGNLDWVTVRPLIESELSKLENVKIYLYEPNGLDVVITPKQTSAPRMTPARAALILLADFCQNNIFDPSLTLLKIHKVLYFLQCSGEDLRLSYGKAYYGPYANNLRHVLQNLEGYYLAGFEIGKEQPNRILHLLPNALELAKKCLEGNEETLQRIQAVEALLEGFETTRGMELLATVHYVYQHESAHTAELAYKAIQHWSSRKAQIFTPHQVTNAFNALKEKGWLK